DSLPDFLGNERHDRVKQAQDGLKCFDKRSLRAAARRDWRRLRLENGLAQFQIPIAKLVPGKFIDRLRGQIESVVSKAFTDPLNCRLKSRTYPTVIPREFNRAVQRGTVRHHEDVSGGIPQFVAEATVTLDAPEVEAQVARERCERGEGEAERIGAVGPDACRELLAGRELDRRGELRLHEAGRALRDQRLEP